MCIQKYTSAPHTNTLILTLTHTLTHTHIMYHSHDMAMCETKHRMSIKIEHRNLETGKNT